MKLSFRSLYRMVVLVALAGMVGCNDPNLINKTKYEGKEYVNTCESFKAEASQLVEANNNGTLKIAEYDNSEYNYMFLEPGQFEIKGDTLYFRLAGDLEYGKYLVKGVSIQVRAYYEAQEHLRDIEGDAQGELGMLVVNEAYWKANSKPFMVYKMKVDKKLDGKKVSLKFSVVKYDKKGAVTKVFCETDKMPLGPLEPACCTDKPWDGTRPKSVVMMPSLDVRDENYRYKGFIGTMDLIHPMSSTKFERKEMVNVISNYISKYEAEGYRVRSITLTGFASQGGKVEFNQKLSEDRARVVFEDLKKEFDKTNRTDVTMENMGRGEDWERLELLVKTADFKEEERGQVLAISGSSKSLDEKEADLRKLKFWNKLVKEVLTYCRHTYVTFQFDKPDGMVHSQYTTHIPVISPELYNVATKQHVIGRFKTGDDVGANVGVLNGLIDQQNNKTGNLYAMRSTYHIALKDWRAAITDIEAAQNADKANMQYALSALAYKTEYSYNYSMTERMKLLNSYNDMVARYPNERALVVNRAVMMDRVGYISGALAAYDQMSSKDAVYYNNRGVARLKTNRVSEAEADFLDATKADANLAEGYFNLGVVYAYKGMTDKAVAALDKAVALRPEFKAEIMSNPVFKVMKSNPKFAKYR